MSDEDETEIVDYLMVCRHPECKWQEEVVRHGRTEARRRGRRHWENAHRDERPPSNRPTIWVPVD
jgi:hypothetical protein